MSRYVFFFQAEDGIRDLVRSRGLGDVYKRQLWYVKIRRPIGEDMERFGLAIAGQVSLPKMKYAAIRGGSLTLFGESHLSAQRRPALVIAEGELDAILLSQVAGDLVDVLTLGGASMHVSMDDLLILAAYPRIIAAHDNDDAGAKARARLAALSAVSYTHLTLPTSDLVKISVVAASL